MTKAQTDFQARVNRLQARYPKKPPDFMVLMPMGLLREVAGLCGENMKKITCNKEDGCMSELWGRDCWVADSVLKLIESAFDPGEYPKQSASADQVCAEVVKYCRELRQKNRCDWWLDAGLFQRGDEDLEGNDEYKKWS